MTRDGRRAPRDTRVTAVVLAAGSSRRMVRNKLMLEVDGETLVRRAVRTATEAGLDEVVVVLGHEAGVVGAALAGLPCVTVVNHEHAQGAGTSIRAGLGRAGAVDAVVLVLADMPFVTAEMIAAVARRYRETSAPLVLSRYGPAQAPPTLFARPLLGELRALGGERGAKDVARRHEREAEVVSWPETALRDVDRPADYEFLRTKAGRTG